MRRRGVGASAVTKKKLETARFKERGNELAAQQLEQLSSQLETFHTNLEEFASKHKQVPPHFITIEKSVSCCWPNLLMFNSLVLMCKNFVQIYLHHNSRLWLTLDETPIFTS